MRALFTFVAGSGHLNPLIPIAEATRAAGHTVAFAGQRSTLPPDFPGFPVEPDFGDNPERRPLLAPDPQREDDELRDGFTRHAARLRAEAITALATDWHPDVIVCDEVNFGAMVAAEHLCIPHAEVIVIASGSFVRKEIVAGPLDELRQTYGLPPDPDLAMIGRHLVLSPVPPSLRHPAFPLPATAHPLRSLTPKPATRVEPAVYFTLGTVYNTESGDLFTRVLAGLRELGLPVIATVGRHIDPAELGPQPANIHVERFIPQAEVLPRVSAVVSHGGSGSLIGALVHGLPSVLIPLGADQPHNARRAEDLGVARTLDPVEATPTDVRDAVRTVLTDPAYRRAAERVREEIAALPGPEHAVALLERLVPRYEDDRR